MDREALKRDLHVDRIGTILAGRTWDVADVLAIVDEHLARPRNPNATQHRTGSSIVKVGTPSWTQRPTGRWTLHLEVSMDQGVARGIVDPYHPELDRISGAICSAAQEATSYDPDA